MFFVNFYECISCSDGENYQVEIKFYPNDADKDSDFVEHIVSMSTRELILFLENNLIDGYMKNYNIEMNDVSQLCKEDYIRELSRPYSDPEAFREVLYETFDFRPQKNLGKPNSSFGRPSSLQ